MPDAREPRAGEVFSLAAAFDQLIEAAAAGDLTVDELLSAFGRRGIGALLILPALLIILPLGLIPGVPYIAALLMIVIAGHMLIGRRRLWLPKGIAQRALPGHTIKSGLERMRPWAVKVDGWMQNRAEWFARSRFASETAAVITILLAIGIAIVGLIPGLPAALSLSVLLFGLGLASRNGLLIVAGYAVASLMACLALWIWPHA